MEESHLPGETPDGEPSAVSAPAPGKPRKKRSRPLELFQTLFVALLLAILIRATVAEARFIPSGSMLPTLRIGDRLIVEKLSAYVHPPHRGDILVFYPPHAGEPPLTASGRLLRWLGFTADVAFIKRVVGLPGEIIAVHDGKVLIDGKPLPEPYLQAPPIDETPPIRIPNGQYFMMGDNRNNSSDSRVWGPLPRANVIGRSFLRIWPLNRVGLL